MQEQAGRARAWFRVADWPLVRAWRRGGGDTLEATIDARTRELRTQVERLQLLDRVIRAIGDQQDLDSLFGVLLQLLEDHLAIEFACACLVDPVTQAMTVIGIGARSRPLAQQLQLTEHGAVPADPNGLARCLCGELLYEADTRDVASPFSQRLAKAGIRSLVAAPLVVDHQVFGVLLAGRRPSHDFSVSDGEFLRQVGDHAALAAAQARRQVALRQAYDDLRQTQQTAMQHERLRALGQMASAIAHDINNALSPAALYAETLRETELGLSPDGDKGLRIIGRAIEDVARTVARLREFYRPRNPQTTPAPIDPGQLVNEVLELTRARWSDIPRQRGIVIAIRTDLPPHLPPIGGTPSEIREALTHLVVNAIDAMPDGGILTLRAYVAETSSALPEQPPFRTLCVEVADTGCGMDDETKRRCVEPFFTTKGERGRGLGLAIVYGTVQRHDAQIEIESGVGKGTTVRIAFPVASDRTASTSGASGAAGASGAVDAVTPDGGPPSIIPLRILVVDDDPMLLATLRQILIADGHTVATAISGQAGIDSFRAAHGRREPFAVVMTDLGMPDVDGRQVASAVKATSPETPVILVTGWAQRLMAEGDVPAHVDRVLGKPPKLRELRAILADCGRLRPF